MLGTRVYSSDWRGIRFSDISGWINNFSKEV